MTHAISLYVNTDCTKNTLWIWPYESHCLDKPTDITVLSNLSERPASFEGFLIYFSTKATRESARSQICSDGKRRDAFITARKK